MRLITEEMKEIKNEQKKYIRETNKLKVINENCIQEIYRIRN